MLNRDIRNTTLYYSAGLIAGLPFAVAAAILVIVGYFHPSGLFLPLAACLGVPVVLLCLRAIIPFCRYLYYRRKYYASQALFLSQSGCSVFQGALGAGKSSLAGYILVTISARLWAQLQTDYLTMSVYVHQWRRQGEWLKLRRWDEVKQAYRYYVKHPDRHPCLLSNIPLEIAGCKVSRLTVDHLLQRKRLPAYTAVFADELGHMIDKWLCRDRNDETDALAELFRFFRQFFGNGCRLIGTEQDSSNVLKDLRRVMVSNEYILGQETVLAPRLLTWLLERRRRKLFDGPLTRDKVDRFKAFERLVKSIGFRRYEYVSLGNTEHDFGSGDVVTVYTPAALNFSYYDRTFERLYRHRYGKVQAEAFRDDTVPPDVQRLKATSTAPPAATDSPARKEPPWFRHGKRAG